MIYLASPYTSNDPDEQRLRYYHACRAAAKLMEKGYVVFSPIAHSHGIARFIRDHDHDFWMERDLPFLEYADRVIVLTLPGWQKSRGIKQELALAKELDIPIEHMEVSE
jgi:nucleoside 2-deoxyribosyltransferase